MKLLLSVVVIFFALNEVFAEEMGPNEDQDYWANGSLMQDEWLQADPFREILRRITRKPRPHQFIGLMGSDPPPTHRLHEKGIKLTPLWV
ncbi:hypothetical protein HF521_015732 [Silurus meridionalis]|uniref:Uncharacterized protein n=1 Tax=Silurus meridionalis TaxID=175797 RepID=A0A8T0A674_SILME|nr:hypothetical protein HF521_015732 [Silurus meridionalis]